MTETKRQEHERLQQRTDQLKKDHADLARVRAPFNQADHDRHTRNLRQHQHDLADHKARGDDEPT
jgi:DNA repair exonuclease SbcCD ATPase subunit